MFKNISPIDPSKEIPIPIDKTQETDSEKKIENIFSEKTLSNKDTKKNDDLKREFIHKLEDLQIDPKMNEYDPLKKAIEQRDSAYKKFKELPKEVQKDPEVLEKVVECLQLNATILSTTDVLVLSNNIRINCKERVIQLYECVYGLLNEFEWLTLENPSIIKQMLLRHKDPFQFEIMLSALSPKLSDIVLKDEEFLLKWLEHLDGISSKGADTLGTIFPKNKEFILKAFAIWPNVFYHQMPDEIIQNPEEIKKYLLKYSSNRMLHILNSISYRTRNNSIDILKIFTKDDNLIESIIKEIANDFVNTNANKKTLESISVSSLDGNLILKLAKIHPYFLKYLSIKDDKSLFEFINQTVIPTQYVLHVENLGVILNDDVINKAVKINPKILLIPSLMVYLSQKNDLKESLEKENPTCILYLNIFNKNFDYNFISDKFESLNDIDLNNIYKEYQSLIEDVERIPNYGLTVNFRAIKKRIYLFGSVISDLRFRRKLKDSHDIIFKFE